MAQQIGEEMEEHTGFFKKVIICIFGLLLLSCSNNNQILTVDEYYNFNFNTFDKLDFIQEQSKITLDNKTRDEITYIAKLKKGKIENDVIESYFVFNGSKYKTPLRFKNFKGYNYKYSLMPKYFDKMVVAKKFNYNNFSVLIIRAENPFCNGNNCKSYYLHLIILKDKAIKANSVYQFNYDDDKFEEFNVSYDNGILLLLDKNKRIDKLKVDHLDI